MTRLRLGLWTACLALAGGSALWSGGARAQPGPRWVPPTGMPVSPAPQPMTSGAYSTNATVGRVLVEVARDGLPADGQTATGVLVRLFGNDGKLLAGDALITVETSGGRIRQAGVVNDETGPAHLDTDRAVPGTQIKVSQGLVRFNLVAPEQAQDVRLRVTAGAAQAEGMVSFVPELRDMLLAGLVEGVLRLSKSNTASLQPARREDGFEQEIRRYSHQFDKGRGDAGLRTAFFLKGRIRGDALLTAAFDSDKETRGRLLRDIQPERYYPVYGDSSVKTFDARSSAKLYVRIDKHKSYLLYGDFNTGDGFSQASSGGMVAPQQLRSLGAYNRSLTGARGHWERGSGVLNVFASKDSLHQVTEELRAFGTSGPFVLRNNSALENSEKLEIVVRRKDSPGTIKSIQALRRYDDYSFEPFSGRILLSRPLPSIDAEGDLTSLRISYEVDQGGERFWVGGVDGQFNPSQHLTLGGALVQDQNPLAPFKMGSLNLGAQLGSSTRMTLEAARTESTLWGNGASLATHPSYAAAEQRLNQAGNAARLALQHESENTTLEAHAIQTSRDFYNPAAPLQQGRSEASVKGSWKWGDIWRFFVELLASKDETSGGRRVGGVVGAEVKLSEQLSLSGGMRKLEENASWNGSSALIVPNPAPSGGGASSGPTTPPTGGLYGGIDPLVINPATGMASRRYGLLPSAASSQGIAVDATTLFLSASYRATERITLQGLVEASVHGDGKRRLMLGAAYRLGERSRLYASFDNQAGITSAFGATRSRAFSLGADTSYMPGGDVYTEYRLRDANARESQWATGVRNTWALREGLTTTTGLEYLSVLNGQGGSAAAATVGLDYSARPLWRLGARLEWRRVFDTQRTAENERADSLLSTLALAHQFDRDWTLLLRNYLLYNRYANRPSNTVIAGQPPAPPGVASSGYAALQNRLQLGAAFRPVDHKQIDALARYEYRSSRNAEGQFGLHEQVHLASVQAVYHPQRPWSFSGRLAAKARQGTGLPGDGPTRSSAWLASGRVVYDISKDWDLGLMAASLQGGPSGSAGASRQTAYGVEAGVLLRDNLWLSAGVNQRGFSDKDLTASETTQRGVYLRLRFKFDEDLLRGNQGSVNRSLGRDTSQPAP